MNPHTLLDYPWLLYAAYAITVLFITTGIFLIGYGFGMLKNNNNDD